MSDDELIEDLILKGGIEPAGIDPMTGEFLYSFTPKIKEIMPDLYDDHISSVNSEVMGLWEKGYLNIDLFEKDPIISLSEKALDYDEVMKLSKREQWSLQEVKRVLVKFDQEL